TAHAGDAAGGSDRSGPWGADAGGEDGDVVFGGGRGEMGHEGVAQLVEVAVGAGEEASELVQTLVEVAGAGFDEAVGVQDEDAAGFEGDLGGGVADAADAQRGAWGQIEQAGGAVG